MLVGYENGESSMDYVVRTLDLNGKLRKERFMFYSVRILDKNEILKKVVKLSSAN